MGVVVALDFCANFLVMLGLFFVGAGVYAVLFSSGIGFAAVLSRCIGGKRYSLRQWTGVGLVTLGMGLNGAVAVAEAGQGEVGRLEVGGAGPSGDACLLEDDAAKISRNARLRGARLQKSAEMRVFAVPSWTTMPQKTVPSWKTAPQKSSVFVSSPKTQARPSCWARCSTRRRSWPPRAP